MPYPVTNVGWVSNDQRNSMPNRQVYSRTPLFQGAGNLSGPYPTTYNQVLPQHPGQGIAGMPRVNPYGTVGSPGVPGIPATPVGGGSTNFGGYAGQSSGSTMPGGYAGQSTQTPLWGQNSLWNAIQGRRW